MSFELYREFIVMLKLFVMFCKKFINMQHAGSYYSSRKNFAMFSLDKLGIF